MEKIAYIHVAPDPRFGRVVLNYYDTLELQAFAHKLGILQGAIEPVGPSGTCLRLTLRSKLGSSELEMLQIKLSEHGLRPHYGYLGVESTPGVYSVRVGYQFTNAEFAAAPFLYIRGFGGGMVGVHGREGDRWIAMSDCVLSDKHSSPKGLRSAIVGETPVFADALKNALEKEGFKHGVFHRLKWDDEAKAPLTLWELDSDITMPPCLTPIVNRDDRYTFEGADGSENPFLDYPAAEVEKFGEFDIAVIRERSPYNDRNDLTDRHLIVSQKFRRFCKKHKVPVSYGLVRFL